MALSKALWCNLEEFAVRVRGPWRELYEDFLDACTDRVQHIASFTACESRSCGPWWLLPNQTTAIRQPSAENFVCTRRTSIPVNLMHHHVLIYLDHTGERIVSQELLAFRSVSRGCYGLSTRLPVQGQIQSHCRQVGMQLARRYKSIFGHVLIGSALAFVSSAAASGFIYGAMAAGAMVCVPRWVLRVAATMSGYSGRQLWKMVCEKAEACVCLRFHLGAISKWSYTLVKFVDEPLLQFLASEALLVLCIGNLAGSVSAYASIHLSSACGAMIGGGCTSVVQAIQTYRRADTDAQVDNVRAEVSRQIAIRYALEIAIGSAIGAAIPSTYTIFCTVEVLRVCPSSVTTIPFHAAASMDELYEICSRPAQLTLLDDGFAAPFGLLTESSHCDVQTPLQ